MGGYQRLRTSLVLFAIVVVVGTVGFRIIGAEGTTWVDSAYMSVVTITSVGYGEVVELETDTAKVFGMLYMLVGLGVLLYVVTTTTAFVVEGDAKQLYHRKRAKRMIQKMQNHCVVCGSGRQGSVVADEFVRSTLPFVIVEGRMARVERLREKYPDVPIIHGDATEEEALREAGIDTAASLVCCLSEDRDNLLLVVTVKQIRPDIHVVCKVMEISDMNKLQRAGADTVVSPTLIGGVRMASEIIRPSVTGFMDKMMRGRNRTLRFEEVVIGPGSRAIGKSLAELKILQEYEMLVLAVCEPGNDEYDFAPCADTPIQEGITLIVLGNTENLPRLRAFME